MAMAEFVTPTLRLSIALKTDVEASTNSTYLTNQSFNIRM